MVYKLVDNNPDEILSAVSIFMEGGLYGQSACNQMSTFDLKKTTPISADIYGVHAGTLLDVKY